VISYEIYSRLRHLYLDKGLKAAQIAEELSLDPKTAAVWIQRSNYQSLHKYLQTI